MGGRVASAQAVQKLAAFAKELTPPTPAAPATPMTAAPAPAAPAAAASVKFKWGVEDDADGKKSAKAAAGTYLLINPLTCVALP